MLGSFKNARIALLCLVVVAAMIGLVSVSLPLYRAFCEATGLGGTTRRASSADPAKAQKTTVEVLFNTEVAPGLPWRFGPDQRSVTATLGKPTLVHFWAENDSDQPRVAHATYNVTPDLAGQYFNKIQCFCFDEERLGPHQRVEMPVLFFVDPKILQNRDIGNLPAITLSYTFFSSKVPTQPIDLARFGSTTAATKVANGDATHGAQIFSAQCAPCHAMDHNKLGPMLGHLNGRKAGAIDGFSYSAALSGSEIIWEPQSLDRWLANPRTDVPGARMPVSVADPQTRADLIAYLLAPAPGGTSAAPASVSSSQP